MEEKLFDTSKLVHEDIQSAERERECDVQGRCHGN